MTTYEKLLQEAHENGSIVWEKGLSCSDGLIYKNRIAISDRLETSTEKACVLAEEIGHYHTAVGDIINLQDIKNLKQEQKGRLHGYNRMIGLCDIISAIDNYVIYFIPNLVVVGTYRYITLRRLYIKVVLQKKKRKANSSGSKYLEFFIFVIFIAFAVMIYSYFWIPAIPIMIYLAKSRKFAKKRARNVTICVTVLITSLITFGYLNVPTKLTGIEVAWGNTEVTVGDAVELKMVAIPSDAEL